LVRSGIFELLPQVVLTAASSSIHKPKTKPRAQAFAMLPQSSLIAARELTGEIKLGLLGL
jgi:hypothetical protein